MNRLLRLLCVAGFLVNVAYGATPAKPAAPALPDASILKGMQWREVGPYRGGRADAVAGIADQPLHLRDGHGECAACGGDHILLHHRTAKIIGPVMERLLRQCYAMRRPGRTQIIEIIQHQPCYCHHAQVLLALDSLPAQLCIIWLVAPADERREPIPIIGYTLILQLPQP